MHRRFRFGFGPTERKVSSFFHAALPDPRANSAHLPGTAGHRQSAPWLAGTEPVDSPGRESIAH
jgi:hypothetical protein